MYRFLYMKRFITASVLTLGLFFVSFHPAQAATVASNLSGRILLQVQDKGQAWYVNPANKMAYYMGRPTDASELIKRLGTGITDYDLRKIPVAPMNYYGTPDADRDGISDAFEQVYGTDMNNPDTDYDGYPDVVELNNGYSPFGAGTQSYDMAFAKSQKGKILIQVQRGGAAWYVNPTNLKAYYLGKPQDAFNVMRALGLGVSNETLAQIPGTYIGNYPYYTATADRYSLRIFNTDNVGTADVNGVRTFSNSYGTDRIEDITNVMHSGSNTIHFKMYNDTGSYTWGFEVKKNGRVIFSESAGTVGQVGANYNDLTKTYQDVYDKMVTLSDSGAVTVTGYQAPTPTPPPPPTTRWYMRVYNADDKESAVINNQYTYTTTFGQDAGYTDITNLLHSGNNTIDFKTWNEVGAYAWGFQILKDNTVVFDEHEGTAGTMGAYSNDGSKPNQFVYNKTVTINQSGLVSVRNNIVPTPPTRWYIREYNGDDKQTMVINNQYSYATTTFGQDSGFIDITDRLHAGNNTLDFKTWNDQGGYTWGFQIRKNNTVVFDENAGVAGIVGAYNNDASRSNQYIYNKTLTLNEAGVASVHNNLSF